MPQVIRAPLAIIVVAWAATATAQLALLSESVITPTALMFSNTSSFSRAINGRSLLSHDGYQFAAWYENDANQSVMVARRRVDGADVGPWDVVNTGSKFVNGRPTQDAHNAISIGIGDDGVIHMAWDMHADTLRYRSTGVGVASGTGWGSSMFGAEKNTFVPGSAAIGSVTYPTFVNRPDGGLLIAYRQGGSGNGDTWLFDYDDTTSTWANRRMILDGGVGSYVDQFNPASNPSGSRNGYWFGFDYGPNGVLYTSWTYRESSNQYANHDLNFALSTDNGYAWKNSAGTTIANTRTSNAITLTDPGQTIQPLDRTQSLMNQGDQALMSDNTFHVVVWHRRPDAPWQSSDSAYVKADSAYYDYVRDPATGVWTRHQIPGSVGTSVSLARSADDTLYAAFIRDQKLTIAAATKAADWDDWSVVYTDSRTIFYESPKIDATRLLNEGVLSVTAQQEPSVSALSGTPLRVVEIMPTSGPQWSPAAGGSWTTAANWSGGVPNSGTAAATIRSTFGGTSSITLDSSVTVNRLFSLASTGTIAPGSGGSLTFGGSKPVAVVTKGLTIAAAISGTFTKSGTGTLTLANTLTGDVTVASGTLRIGNGDAAGAVTGRITTRGPLIVDRSGTVAFPSPISGEGSLTLLGSGTAILTGTASHTGGTTISNGRLQIGDGGTTGSLTGSVTTDASLAFNRRDAVTFATAISGTGGVVQIGSGTLTLTGGNTYSGGTSLLGGVISFGGAGRLGTGPVTVAGSAIRLLVTGSATLANDLTVSSPAGSTGYGTVHYDGTTTGKVTGAVTVLGDAATGGTFGSSGGGSLVLEGPVAAVAAAKVSVRTGTVVFAGGGDYPVLTIKQGTAKVGRVDGMATSAVVAIGASGAATLDLAGFDQSLVGISKGTQPATIGNSSTARDAILTLTGSSSFAGTIRDAINGGTRRMSLAVDGGWLSLTAANTLSGSTTVRDGTLRIANANALASSTVMPLAGGTATLAPGLAATVGGLHPNEGGLVDLGTGSLTVTSGLSQPDVLAALLAGRGDGMWNGPHGIGSSAIDASFAAGAPRTIGWLAQADGSISIAYAAPGDTNLDASIDLLDAANFVAGGMFDAAGQAVWADGDFTYDGLVDLLDAADLLSTGLFDAGPYSASGVIAVPEPTLGLVLAALMMLLPVAARSAAAETRPNIVVILMDDLGYNDVGAFTDAAEPPAAPFPETDTTNADLPAPNLARHLTPHIDALAATGMRMTAFHSSPKCSPSRASLLTGRYDRRLGINTVFFPNDPHGLTTREVTLAEQLRECGYATAMIGKWHLGYCPAAANPFQLMPTRHGFEEFYGVPHSNDMKEFSLIENETVVDPDVSPPDKQAELTWRCTERAIDFIHRSAGSHRPFFLLLAHTMPHIPVHPSNRPFPNADGTTWPAFRGSSGVSRYYDVVKEMDHAVGRITSLLDTAGLADDTIVIFTSDNGPWRRFKTIDRGIHSVGSAHPLRDSKSTTWEGGCRVPFIVRWPRGISPGRTSNAVAGLVDLFPTLVSLAGGDPASDRTLDGVDLRPVWCGEADITPTRPPYALFEGNGRLGAVIAHPWKLRDDKLYDLTADVGERTNVASDHPGIVASLQAAGRSIEASIEAEQHPQGVFTPFEVEVSTDAVRVPNTGEAVMQIRLSGRPEQPVTVDVGRFSGSARVAVARGMTHTFTPSDWDRWRDVAVVVKPEEPGDDATAPGGNTTLRITSPHIDAVREVFVSTVAAAITPAALGKLGKATRPNMLFIAVDDLRPELGCYGAAAVRTPHIDRLASRSVVFERAYCQVPVCGASRASLMTGILPTRTRFRVHSSRADEDAPGCPTLPQVLREAGYVTISNGKVLHHADDTADRSWTEKPWLPAASHLDALDPTTTATRSDADRGRIYESPEVDDGAYADGQIAEKTMADLRRLAEGDSPFFLACGFHRPHLPFYAPKQYWNLYDREALAIADHRSRPADAPTGLKGSGEYRNYLFGGYADNSDDFHRLMRHGYYASTSYVDAQIGRVLDELDRLGLADDTIVVLWGDHGWNLGEHDFWGKHNTMHPAVRVPLMIRLPHGSGGRSKALVGLIDLFPTLCDLARLQVPETVQGRSFTTVLDDPSRAFRDVVYARYAQGDCVVTDRSIYTRYAGGGEMLYDLDEDPGETRNVAANAESVRADMQAMLEQCLAEADRARVPTPSGRRSERTSRPPRARAAASRAGR